MRKSAHLRTINLDSEIQKRFLALGRAVRGQNWVGLKLLCAVVEAAI